MPLVAKDTDTRMGVYTTKPVEIVEVLDAFTDVVSINPTKVLPADWTAKNSTL